MIDGAVAAAAALRQGAAGKVGAGEAAAVGEAEEVGVGQEVAMARRDDDAGSDQVRLLQKSSCACRLEQTKNAQRLRFE